MSDAELLEWAARAAGRADVWGWNPLADDGDALRLACQLRMSLNFSTARNGQDTAYGDPLDDVVGETPTWTTESMRRAIVTAAAAIGRAGA